MQVCKRAQKGANERKRALPHKNCKKTGLKQTGLGAPNFHVTGVFQTVFLKYRKASPPQALPKLSLTPSPSQPFPNPSQPLPNPPQPFLSNPSFQPPRKPFCKTPFDKNPLTHPRFKGRKPTPKKPFLSPTLSSLCGGGMTF